jgi:hypothetical protein
MKDFGKDVAGLFAVAFFELTPPNIAGQEELLAQAKCEGSGTPPMSMDQNAALRKYVIDTQTEAGSYDVCVVTVKPSPKPRFFVEEGKEKFYIRTGNPSNELKMSELLDYYKLRWPEGTAITTV